MARGLNLTLRPPNMQYTFFTRLKRPLYEADRNTISLLVRAPVRPGMSRKADALRHGRQPSAVAVRS